MWGWVGEIAKVFVGQPLLLAGLIVIVLQMRVISTLISSNDKARAALLSALNNSTNAQLNVAVVLSRIESKLGATE